MRFGVVTWYLRRSCEFLLTGWIWKSLTWAYKLNVKINYDLWPHLDVAYSQVFHWQPFKVPSLSLLIILILDHK